MELDLDKTEAVQVRRVLFLVKDAMSRPAMLILDFDNLKQLLRPSPDGDGTDELEMGFHPIVPSSLLFRHFGERAVLQLKHESAPTLELSVPPQLSDIIRSGGQIRWRRMRTGRQAAGNSRRPRPRPVTLSAVLLREVVTPSSSRLVSPDAECAKEFEELVFRGRPATPRLPDRNHQNGLQARAERAEVYHRGLGRQ